MDDKTLLLKAARAAGYGLNARGQSLRETEMPAVALGPNVEVTGKPPCGAAGAR